MPGTAGGTLAKLDQTCNILGRYLVIISPHFADEKAENQRGEVTWPRSLSCVWDAHTEVASCLHRGRYEPELE